jgi:hypothetical protein
VLYYGIGPRKVFNMANHHSPLWEESQRRRDGRQRKLRELTNSMSEDYFRCLDCGRFCEDYDESEEADVCFRCFDDNNPQMEDTTDEE